MNEIWKFDGKKAFLLLLRSVSERPVCVSRRCIHLEKCSDASARDICERHERTPHFLHFPSFVFLQPLSLNCNKSHPAKRPRYITPHRDASLGAARTVSWMASWMTTLPLFGSVTLRNQRLLKRYRTEAEAEQRQSNLAVSDGLKLKWGGLMLRRGWLKPV